MLGYYKNNVCKSRFLRLVLLVGIRGFSVVTLQYHGQFFLSPLWGLAFSAVKIFYNHISPARSVQAGFQALLFAIPCFDMLRMRDGIIVE
jgi:hypothetical protein